MSAKRKLLISMLSIVFVLLAVVATATIVFALTQQNVKTSLNIEYTVEDIDGSVYATYTIGGTTNYLEPIADADHVSADNRSLIFKATDTESAGNLRFPEGQISLSAQNDNVVIQYTYSNTGDKHYIASLSFDSEPTHDNMKIEYSINGVDYSADRYAVVVPSNSTGKSYWIRISIDDKSKNASFKGDFNWLLSGCDPQSKEYLSLTSLEMQATGTKGEYKVSVASAGEYAGKLVIPSEVNGNPVTTIAANSSLTQAQKDQITSVYIPASVTTIYLDAFENYTNLQTVTFAENSQLTSIGSYAFAYCEGLTSVTFAEDSQLTSIGYSAFEGCTSLTSIEIPASVTEIKSEAFYGCTGLTSIEVEEGNTVYHSAGNCLIETENKTLILGCKTSVIPTDGSVTSIGAIAFSGCTGLTSIEIPASVTSIGNSAFYECTSLTSIEIPASVTSIGEHAFYYCTGLTSVTFAENSQLTSIERYVFGYCTSLTSIEIPDSVTWIGAVAFYYCTGLKSLTIGSGASLDTWATSPFDGCTNLRNVTLNTMNSSILEEIEELASENGEMQVHLKIGNSVTSIEDGVFQNCIWLTSVTFAEDSQLTSIGEFAFSGCTSLTSIVIPASVTSIGYGAFANCELTSLEVASGNTKYHSAGNCVIETASKTLASACNISVIPTDGSVTSIGDFAFAFCVGLTSIEIPDSVTSIGNAAFGLCTSLTSIVIPESVTSIGQQAFAYCGSLTSVTFENTEGWTVEDVEGDEGTFDVPSETFSDTVLIAQALVEGTNYVWRRS